MSDPDTASIASSALGHPANNQFAHYDYSVRSEVHTIDSHSNSNPGNAVGQSSIVDTYNYPDGTTMVYTGDSHSTSNEHHFEVGAVNTINTPDYSSTYSYNSSQTAGGVVNSVAHSKDSNGVNTIYHYNSQI